MGVCTFEYSGGKLIVASALEALHGSLAHSDQSCLMFADDVKLFTEVSTSDDATALQADLNSLQIWSDTWVARAQATAVQVIHFDLKAKTT